MLFRSGLQVETLIVSGQAGATSGGGPAPTPRPTTPVADPRRQPPTRDGRVPTDEEQEVDLPEQPEAPPVVLISTRSADEVLEFLDDGSAIGFLAKKALGAEALLQLLDHRAPR